MSAGIASDAIVFERPGELSTRSVFLSEPSETELVVDVAVSGISTGTEKLLWTGDMPDFPGLGYPLVPGYEAVGTVRQAGAMCNTPIGTKVFVPGAGGYPEGIRGLFGASASTLVVAEQRVTAIGQLDVQQGALLALAATAMHVLTYRLRKKDRESKLPLSQLKDQVPDLIIGHGVLGRLLARLCLSVGAEAPLVWEIDDFRRNGSVGYEVCAPGGKPGQNFSHVVDVSGAGGEHFNQLIMQLRRAGLLTLAGFYKDPVSFDFPLAFMREATIGIAAEWVPDDLALVMRLLENKRLSLDGLISHEFSAKQAAIAYPQAFNDPACLKTILNWEA